MEKTIILNDVQIKQKIKRIAYEVVEGNLNESTIVLAGIAGDGYEVAKRLKSEIRKIKNFELPLLEIKVDKAAPTQGDIELSKLKNNVIEGSVILIIDDVLNTGRTLAYCLKPFLSNQVKKIETAVLVNRSHTTFPIAPTYTGYELSTTLKDHVKVELSGTTSAVYLQ